MAEQQDNSLSFKLVYYGPAQSGKTTSSPTTCSPPS